MSKSKYYYQVLKGNIYLSDLPSIHVLVPYHTHDDLIIREDGETFHDNSYYIVKHLKETKQIDITQIIIDKLQKGEIKVTCDIDNDDLYECEEEIESDDNTVKRIKPDGSERMKDVNGDIIVSVYP